MELEQYLDRHKIAKDVQRELYTLMNYKEYQPGEYILNMGENTQEVCLILQGIVRGYYVNENGHDVTKCFSKEGNWCCFYNFLQEGPSEFIIETLEKCRVARIRVVDLQSILNKYPMLQNMYETLVRGAFLKVEERNASFLQMNAKERYLSFIKKHNEINQRVKQEYIASYLGITPSSLSRIKREL